MANKAPRAKAKASARTESLPSKWESVTWGDIANWAGPSSVARGRAYQRGRRVRDLAISEEGRLLAKVAGGHLYATAVWWEADVLRSRCTCPAGGNGCKHAVAVVAAYLDMLAKDTQVPIADAEDGRWAQLANNVPEALHEYFDFGRPVCKTFTELVAAADHAGCREGVARLGREFLETGELPFSVLRLTSIPSPSGLADV